MSTHDGDVNRTLAENQAVIESFLSYVDSMGFNDGPFCAFTRIPAKPGRAEEIVSELRKFEAKVRVEPDTLIYALFRDNIDENQIYIYQMYTNVGAFKRHMRTPSYYASINPIVNATDGVAEYRCGSPQFVKR
jgi:quinol monooxygenase YgiN